MRIVFILLLLITGLKNVSAQENDAPFCAYIYNYEYQVFMRIDFIRQSIMVPGQEVYGALPGYLGKEKYSFCWPVVSAKIEGRKATMELVNDYGSEDLTASLTQINDSTYELKQLSGSALKMPQNRKWQKLPKTLIFIKK